MRTHTYLGIVLCAVFQLCILTKQAWCADEFHLINFQVSALAATQSASGGSAVSGTVNWAPILRTGVFSFRLNIGASLLPDQFEGKFVSVDTEFLGAWHLGSFGVEGGGGAQTWLNNGGTSPAISGGVFFAPEKMLFLGFINRIYAEYTRVFITDNGANEFQLGIGMGF